MLAVRLLGRVSVTWDGAAMPAFSSGPLLRLLTALVLRSGEPVTRTELAFRLWPDSSEAQARTNLRKALHLLRQELDQPEHFVETAHTTVRWLTGGPAQVDVTAFLAASTQGIDEQAVRQYGGSLLPGVYDEWVLEERARLHGLVTSALARLVESSGHDDVTSLGYALKLVDLEPASEWAHRHVIDLHRRRGDRASAVRAYHRCVELLSSELGVDPAPETRALYQQLVEGVAANTGATPTRPAPLVGRQGEWAALEYRWNRVGVDPLHLVVVVGEAGVGKSRLVADFGRSVRAEDALVLGARSYETLDAAWAPVATWLRDDELIASLADAPAGLLSEVSRLAPQLRTRADVPSPTPVVDELGRFQFYDALATAVLYGGAPRFLVLDDLQWCDAPTLSLVTHLLHTRPSEPALIVGLVRMEEIDDDHPFLALRDAFAADGRVSVIELERLSPEETAELADAVASTPLDPAAHARLWTESEGNPLFVLERLKTDPPGVDSGPSTPTVRAVIERRLRRLSPEARRVAETAAVLGTEFCFDELAAVVGGSSDQLVSALDELWRRRIVGEVGGRYDFTHDKLREVAAAGLSAARRRQLHGDVATGLIEVHGPNHANGRLAIHLRAAARPAEAVNAFRRSAAASVELYDLDVAVGTLRSALELIPALPEGSDAEAAEQELLIDLGAVLVARNGYGSAEVRDVYNRAMVLAHITGQTVDPAIRRGLRLAAVAGCRFEEAERHGRYLATTLGDPIARTEGDYLLGVSAFWRGDLAGSASALESSIRSYDPDRREMHQARFAQDPYPVCLVRLAVTRFWQGDEPAAADLADQAIRWCDRTGHRHTTGYVLAYIGMLAAEQHDAGRLEAVVRRGREPWTGAQGFFGAFGPLYDGWRRVVNGDQRGVRDIDDALEGWRRSRQVLHLTHGLVLRARAALLAGEPDTSEHALNEALRRTATTGQRYLLAEVHRLSALTVARHASADAAQDDLDRAIAIAASMGATGAELRARSTRLELLGRGRAETEALVARMGDKVPALVAQEAKQALRSHG